MSEKMPLLIPLAVFLGSLAGLFLLRRIVLGVLQRLTRRTQTNIDDLLVSGLRIPSLFLVIVLSAYIGIRLADLPEAWLTYATRGLYLSLILAVTMGIANVSDRLLAFFLKRVEVPIAVTSLLLAVVRSIVYVVGTLVILNFLGISITPIITALGVGGLAMALALQDTLSNLFAGIHIMAEQAIRVGDFIRLESGQEGQVEDISWRTTRIRTLPNTMVIVPNNKLSQSVITNYYLPDRTLVLPVPVSVSYSSDPDRVEQVLLDEATRAVSEVPGIIAESEPVVRFQPGFGESSLNYTLFCRIRDIQDQGAVLSELNRRILRRFRREGIAFPFPTRTVHLQDERSSR